MGLLDERFLSKITKRMTQIPDGNESGNGYLFTAEHMILNLFDLDLYIDQYITASELSYEHCFVNGMFQRMPEPYLETKGWDRFSHDEVFGLAVMHLVHKPEALKENWLYEYLKGNAWTYHEKKKHVKWYRYLFDFSNLKDLYKLAKTGLKSGIGTQTDKIVASNRFIDLLAARISWRDRYVVTLCAKGECYNPFYHLGFSFRTLVTAMTSKSRSSLLLAYFKCLLVKPVFGKKKLTVKLFAFIIKFRLGAGFESELAKYFVDEHPTRLLLES